MFKFKKIKFIDMPHSNFLYLSDKVEGKRPQFEKHNIQCPESIIRYFIEKHTKPGDVVLDPFSGLGSTLYVAESLDRKAYGVEADLKRFKWIQSNLSTPERIIHGDSANITKYGLPKIDFSFTSPPYMPMHHQWNPLCPTDINKRGYINYLKQLKKIYSQVKLLMKRGTFAIIQVDNLTNKVFTPLAWDIASTVSEVLRFEGETVVVHSKSKKESPEHTYCFTFKKI